MNLTKGKISKLYSKKKQSLKRNKNKRGHSSKSKTFRKNRRVNLARKSLKRLHFKANKGGGLNDETGPVNDTELPKETTDNKQVDEYLANIASRAKNDETKAEPSQFIGSAFKSPPEPSSESSAFGESSSALYETPPVDVTPPPAPVLEETPSPAPIVDETPSPVDVTPSPVVDPAVDVTPSPVDVTPSPVVDPAVDVTPSPVVDPVVDVTPSPVVDPAVDVTPSPVVDPVVDETPPSPSVDPVTDEPTASPTVDESANNEDPELASAINNVVSLITEKVTKKVSEEVNANSSDAAQNGFKEIDDTARIMGSSGGGKKSKSKKSRNNKTRRKNKNRRIA